MTYLNGPLTTFPERRDALVRQMAADLGQPVPDRQDAVRLLCTQGYSIVAVHCLVDDARAVAFQEVAAKKMSDRKRTRWDARGAFTGLDAEGATKS